MIPQMLNAAQTAAIIGLSPSYFYKLRSTAPESLPPAVEHMNGRKIKPRWDSNIVDQWLNLQNRKAENELKKQREKIENELVAAIPVIPKKSVVRARW
jgi:predicted DNA-binding transcriptional regulator AlpA